MKAPILALLMLNGNKANQTIVVLQDGEEAQKWLPPSQVPGYCASMICRTKATRPTSQLRTPRRQLYDHLTPPQPETEEILDLRDFLSIEAWTERDMPPPDRLLGDLVTTTTRTFLVGHTGLGKTMLALALAGAMASGRDFLHWKVSRPARVLVIDGEMPGELIRQRTIDVLRRAKIAPPHGNLTIYARDMEDQFAEQLATIGRMPPLNSEEGRQWLLALINGLGGHDVIIFDNVMSLITGDQKDKVPWSDAWELIQSLTARRIGQIWLDHTGHNTSRQYGSSTKAWRFDAVGIMTPLPDDQREPHDLAFTLSFEPPGKARRRTPGNRRDFETCTIRLSEDEMDGAITGARVGTGSAIADGQGILPCTDGCRRDL